MKRLIPGLLAVVAALMCGACPASEPTSADTVIYRGGYAATSLEQVFYRSARGEYMRRIENSDGGAVETETRYSSLGAFRAALLGVDDRAGIMGASSWRSDADGDGYSDMLEYLTNGDPYAPSTVPTEPRFLYFDGGSSFVPLVPLPDMESVGGPEPGDDAASVAGLLERADALLTVLCYAVGLFMWRLVVLSKSQRSIL